MKQEKIKELITPNFSDSIVEIKDQTLTIEREALLPVCKFLHENKETYFDMLSCITGIDNGLEENSMEVIYTLYSIYFDYKLSLKVVLNREDPIIDSVSLIWKAAVWHERETYDLFGIQFNNHPDLRRILMPNDWQGYPLRKDYQEQESYHGIPVKWENRK